MYTVDYNMQMDIETIRRNEIIYENSKDYLRPNLTGIDIILNSMKEIYTFVEFDDEVFLDIIKENTDIKYGRTKGKEIQGYKIVKDEKSEELFSKQEEVFKDMGCILVGVNLENNGFYIEGSSLLRNRITCQRGLSEEEIKNKWLATEYIINCNS